MGLRMAFYRHYPEKEKETSDGEEACPLEKIIRFALFPTEIDGKTETYGVENEQLIRDVFQQILQSETFVATHQVILEAREIVVDLPEDMRDDKQCGKQDGYPNPFVFQQFEI